MSWDGLDLQPELTADACGFVSGCTLLEHRHNLLSLEEAFEAEGDDDVNNDDPSPMPEVESWMD